MTTQHDKLRETATEIEPTGIEEGDIISIVVTVGDTVEVTANEVEITRIESGFSPTYYADNDDEQTRADNSVPNIIDEYSTVYKHN